MDTVRRACRPSTSDDIFAPTMCRGWPYGQRKRDGATMVGRVLIVCVWLLVPDAKPDRKDYNFFPNLPAGEFRWYFKSMVPCSLPHDSIDETLKFRHSLFFSKTSRNTTELRGTVTTTIPFDDSLTFHVNFAIKDSIGGWKDNALVYRTPKSCSTSKRFLGADWPLMLKTFGANTTDCPVPPGTYVSKGYDLSDLGSRLNIPKTFFYGVYKMRVYFTDQREKVYGCGIFVIAVKRPWETE